MLDRRPAPSPHLFANGKDQGYIDERTGEAPGCSIWQRFMDRMLAETKATKRFTTMTCAKCASDAESRGPAKRHPITRCMRDEHLLEDQVLEGSRVRRTRGVRAPRALATRGFRMLPPPHVPRGAQRSHRWGTARHSRGGASRQAEKRSAHGGTRSAFRCLTRRSCLSAVSAANVASTATGHERAPRPVRPQLCRADVSCG